MRWFKKHKIEPRPGDVRCVKRFLFLPTELLDPERNGYQVRWLEMVTIEQRCEGRGNFEAEWVSWADQAFVK